MRKLMLPPRPLFSAGNIYKIGQRIECFLGRDWKAGTIYDFSVDTKLYKVYFDDTNSYQCNIRGADIREFRRSIGHDFDIDDKVGARYPESDMWFPATVTRLTSNGTYTLAFDDGDTRYCNVQPHCIRRMNDNLRTPFSSVPYISTERQSNHSVHHSSRFRNRYRSRSRSRSRSPKSRSRSENGHNILYFR